MKHASWIFIVGGCVAAAGCGQKGALYLPDKNASVVTRPANSGATTSAPATQPAPAPTNTTPGAAAPTPAKPPEDKNGDDSQTGTPKG